MCEITALSADALEIDCEDSDTIIVETDDQFKLTSDWEDYEEGELLSVEPDTVNEDYALKIWSEKSSNRWITGERICELVCGGISNKK